MLNRIRPRWLTRHRLTALAIAALVVASVGAAAQEQPQQKKTARMDLPCKANPQARPFRLPLAQSRIFFKVQGCVCDYTQENAERKLLELIESPTKDPALFGVEGGWSSEVFPLKPGEKVEKTVYCYPVTLAVDVINWSPDGPGTLAEAPETP